jgi:membrane protein implicated in regulation of membrane protease activity
MNGRIHNPRFAANPVVQVLSVLVLGIVMIGAVLLGAVILAFALGFALIAAIVLYLRIWWLARRARRGRSRSRDAGTAQRHIDVEYRVVDERDPGERGR